MTVRVYMPMAFLKGRAAFNTKSQTESGKYDIL